MSEAIEFPVVMPDGRKCRPQWTRLSQILRWDANETMGGTNIWLNGEVDALWTSLSPEDVAMRIDDLVDRCDECGCRVNNHQIRCSHWVRPNV